MLSAHYCMLVAHHATYMFLRLFKLASDNADVCFVCLFLHLDQLFFVFRCCADWPRGHESALLG